MTNTTQNEEQEYNDNVIEVQRWKRNGVMRFCAVLVLMFAVGGFLLTAAVSIGNLGGAAIRATLGAEENGLQRP